MRFRAAGLKMRFLGPSDSREPRFRLQGPPASKPGQMTVPLSLASNFSDLLVDALLLGFIADKRHGQNSFIVVTRTF